MKEDSTVLRDHKVIGKQLGYYFIDKKAGGNLPFITEKGALVIQTLKRFIENVEFKRGFSLVQSPLISNTEYLETSDHLYHYKDMIFESENANKSKISFRPVTCPFHFSYYNKMKHGYRDLPVRYFETTSVFRKCKTGEQNGLFRTQFFTIGDSHIICCKDHIPDELNHSIKYILHIIKALKLEDHICFVLSSGIEKDNILGNKEEWKEARNILEKALINNNLSFTENKKSAAFYGPKIDVYYKGIRDNAAVFTIQLDFQLAKKFNMIYYDSDCKEIHPVIIHRSSMSSYERMLGVLLENYDGDLPFWISPIQVLIIVIDRQCDSYANTTFNKLSSTSIRTKIKYIDNSQLSQIIKQAISEKIPYMVVIGTNEMENGYLSVRIKTNNEAKRISLDKLILELNEIRRIIIE